MKVSFKSFLEITRSSTARSISLLISGNLVNAGLGFVSSILVLRKLDKESIALLYPLIGILMISEQFGDLGLSTSFVKIASNYAKSNKSRTLRICHLVFRLKLGLSVGVIVIGWLLAPLISQWIFSSL